MNVALSKERFAPSACRVREALVERRLVLSAVAPKVPIAVDTKPMRSSHTAGLRLGFPATPNPSFPRQLRKPLLRHVVFAAPPRVSVQGPIPSVRPLKGLHTPLAAGAAQEAATLTTRKVRRRRLPAQLVEAAALDTKRPIGDVALVSGVPCALRAVTRS